MTTRMIVVVMTMIALALFWANILLPLVDESFWHSFWHGLTISTPLADTELDLTKNSVTGGASGMIVGVQVARIGNSVCPPVASALVKANVGAELCV